MFKRFSRTASAFAVAAALSMTAMPVAAEARGWGGGGWGGGWGRGHHDDIDAGDIFAGILIIGGIAAIASAASKANRDNRARTTDRNDGNNAPDNRTYREPAPRYGEQDNRPVWQEGRGIDNAVNACVSEVERSSNRVENVDAVNRDGEGWRVEGRVNPGRSFVCSIGNDGRIRSVSVDGKAAYAGDAPRFVSQPVVQGTKG